MMGRDTAGDNIHRVIQKGKFLCISNNQQDVIVFIYAIPHTGQHGRG